MKKVLFILSGNLATTPRALKAILCLSENFSVRIVAVDRTSNWRTKDQHLIHKHKLDVVSLSLERKPVLPWIKTTLAERFAKHIYKYGRNNLKINAYASNKASIVLWDFLKRVDYSGFHYIVGHSGGSLFPAYKLSLKWDKGFIFDVEDYHPGEYVDEDARYEKERREFLMKKILPKARGLTFASPLIRKHTLDLIGRHTNECVILNSFPQNEFRELNKREIGDLPDQALKFIWFGQKIGFNRGLEQLFESLLEIKLCGSSKNIQLTLIGEIDGNFETKIVRPFLEKLKGNKVVKLKVMPPISQYDLHYLLSEFDIGLALEFDTADLNRQLCLTNKILAYAQAGLFILATNTKAQRQFIEEHPDLGILSSQNATALQENLEHLLDIGANIKRQSQERFEKAKTLNWEQESIKFLNLCNNI